MGLLGNLKRHTPLNQNVQFVVYNCGMLFLNMTFPALLKRIEIAGLLYSMRADCNNRQNKIKSNTATALIASYVAGVVREERICSTKKPYLCCIMEEEQQVSVAF